jgi:hypothetical protein
MSFGRGVPSLGRDVYGMKEVLPICRGQFYH